jgi:hypothetical protein
MPLATALAVSLKIPVVYITNFYHLTLERCSRTIFSYCHLSNAIDIKLENPVLLQSSLCLVFSLSFTSNSGYEKITQAKGILKDKKEAILAHLDTLRQEWDK